MSKRLFTAIAALLAIALIAGCGGGDGGDTTASETSPSAGETSGGADAAAGGGTTLSKSEFIKVGDEICKESQEDGEKKIGSFLEGLDLDENGEPSKEDQEELVDEIVVPTLQDSADGLRELTPPAGEEDAVAEIVDGLDEAIASVEDDPIAALEGDPFADVNEKAIAYGFKVCGEN